MAADGNGTGSAGQRLPEWLSRTALEWLEDRALPDYLPHCRWFGGKDRMVSRVMARDCLPDPRGGAWALLLLDVEFSAGAAETYSLPIMPLAGAAADEFAGRHAGALIGGGPDRFFDATFHPAFRARLLDAIAHGESWPGWHGAMVGMPEAGLSIGNPSARGESFLLRAEQSNTAVIWPERHFLKLLRRCEMGLSPELEILRHLSRQTAFRRAPTLQGSLEYRRGENEPATLALLQALIPHDMDAWGFALRAARGYHGVLRALSAEARRAGLEAFRQAQGLSRKDPLGILQVTQAGSWAGAGAFTGDGMGGFVRTLGRRTAEMHAALSFTARGSGEAFALEYLGREARSQLSARMRAAAGRILDQLERSAPGLSPARADLGAKVLRARSRIDAGLSALGEGPADLPVCRIHGDYHLGQVLVAGDDAVILDFEGEPARPLAERRRKQSPWKDVAGMLRSFDYAAHFARPPADAALSVAPATGWPEALQAGLAAEAELEILASLWPKVMSAWFLEGYLSAAESAPGAAAFLGPAAARHGWLDAFIIEKAVYELGYEMGNRPDWVHIPLLGIMGLLGE